MATSTSYDIAVVGNGMFGAAATRYLARSGCSTICIGAPNRPSQVGDSTVFSSHDDAARLVRYQAHDELWMQLTTESFAAFPEIESESGIGFHEPVGCLTAGPPEGDDVNDDPRQGLKLTGLESAGVDHQYFAADDRGWRDLWPMLDFPAGHYVIHEPGPAGFIRPHDLIAAQNTLASRSGAVITEGTVIGIERTGGGFRLAVDDGQRVDAERVLVAAGAFANQNNLLPAAIELRCKSEVIVLAEVSESDVLAMGTAPSVKFLLDDPFIEGIYMTPPARYDDGRWCVKLGANTVHDADLGNLDDIQRWFAKPTRADYVPLFQAHVDALWPTTEFVSYTTKNCIITYSPDGHPIIDQVDDGLFIVTAGNGVGAMSSDAVGAHAARLVTGSG